MSDGHFRGFASDNNSGAHPEVIEAITAVNEALADQPDLVNTDPYGEGWLLDIDVEDQEEVEALMDADTYQGQLEQN